MGDNTTLDIAVLPGDGIGREVIAATVKVLRAAQRHAGGFELALNEMEAGAELYRRTGDPLPLDVLKACGTADAVLLGAMGLPEVRYEDGREIAPQLDLREKFELFAGVRPIRSIPGAPSPLVDPRAQSLDFVLIRESTEGLFSSRGKIDREGNELARDRMLITRKACERLFRFTFDYALERKAEGKPGKVTCVDKANVLGSMAFFREIFDEIGAEYPEVEKEHAYIDATAMNLVKRPWDFDVMVTENLLGDILSDLGAGLVGGLGVAPSADIGIDHAVFQPCHGTAPDIMGQNKANPAAAIMSGAMMLDWLGTRTGMESCRKAADAIEAAVVAAFASGDVLSIEYGGSDGTDRITEAIIARLGA
jgi:3-isopropylmalate dehydrogenase